MNYLVSPDVSVNQLFEQVASEMGSLFGYSKENAWVIIENYYRLFTDEMHCSRLGVSVQDDDFFFHEAPLGMALRVQYFVGLEGRPDQTEFLNWRQSVVKKMKEQQRGSFG